MKNKTSLLVTLFSSSALLFSCGGGGGDPAPGKTFSVTWDLGDQQIVEKYKEGETPHFDYTKYTFPIKDVGEIIEDNTEQLGSCFSNWDKDIVPITEDTTYKATYSTRSLVTRLVFNPPNGTQIPVKFKCERIPTLVNWGDGSEAQVPTENMLTHAYDISSVDGSDRHRVVYIFGDIGSITFIDEESEDKSLLDSHNYYFTSIFLSPYVTSIHESAFPIGQLEALFIPYSVKTIGKKVACGNGRDSARQYQLMIFVETKNDLAGWDDEWKRSSEKDISKYYYNAIYSVSDIGFGLDESNKNNVYMTAEYDGKEHTALVRHFPASDEENEYTIPKGVETNLGDKVYSDILFHAFENSPYVTITFAQDNELTYIGSNAFKDSRNLTTFISPKNVVAIGELAFAGCSSLTSVTLSDKVEEIGSNAFQSCGSLSTFTYDGQNAGTGEAYFPTTLKAIKDYAFFLDQNLITFHVPNSVETFGMFTFQNQNATDGVTIDMSAYTDANTIPYVPVNFIGSGLKSATIKHSSNVSVDDFYAMHWPKHDGTTIIYNPAPTSTL